MPTPADDLRTILYQHMIGRPDDPTGGMHEASDTVGYLVELVEGMQMGDYDYEEVNSAFSKSGPKDFSFPAWYAQMVQEDRYS